MNTKLAITLERISYEPTSFYSGSLAEDIAKDIAASKGIVTEKDLSEYNVEVEPAVKTDFQDLELHTTGLPSSGVLTAFMLNVLKGLNKLVTFMKLGYVLQRGLVWILKKSPSKVRESLEISPTYYLILS